MYIHRTSEYSFNCMLNNTIIWIIDYIEQIFYAVYNKSVTSFSNLESPFETGNAYESKH